MNYCPNCGSKVESFWRVCAYCGRHLTDEEVSIITQKEPEYQIKTIETVSPKPSIAYFEPHRSYGSIALGLAIIGLSLTFLIVILRILNSSPPSLFIFNNVMILVLGILSIIFGIIGIVKDDPRAMAIVGLVLGAGGLVVLYVRFIIFMVFQFYTPFLD